MNPFDNISEPKPTFGNRPERMSEEKIRERMKEIQAERVSLLDKHGLFGGGTVVNKRFDALNIEYDNLNDLLSVTK